MCDFLYRFRVLSHLQKLAKSLKKHRFLYHPISYHSEKTSFIIKTHIIFHILESKKYTSLPACNILSRFVGPAFRSNHNSTFGISKTPIMWHIS